MKAPLSLRPRWLMVFLILFTLFCLLLNGATAARLLTLAASASESQLMSASSNGVHRVEQQLQQLLSSLEHTAAACAALPDDQARMDYLSELSGKGAPTLGLYDAGGTLVYPNGMGTVLAGPLLEAAQSGSPCFLFSEELSPNHRWELIRFVPLPGSESGAGVLARGSGGLSLETLLSAPGFPWTPLLVDRNGEVLLTGSSSPAWDRLFVSLAEECGLSRREVDGLAGDMADGTRGLLSLRWQNRQVLMAYAPLETGGLYLVTLMDPVAGQASLYQALLLDIASDLLLLCAFLLLALCYRRYQCQTTRLLEEAAYVDPVTGGHNQARFLLLAQEAIQTHPPGYYALVSCDIQAFSLINRTFGKAAGNRVLHYLSDTLRSQLRSDELAARMAQDQFILLLRREDEDAMRARMVAMAQRLNRFNNGKENPYYLPLAVGICPQADASTPLPQLCDWASLARKRAKRYASPGLCACAFHRPADQQRLLLDQRIYNQMNTALERGDFKVYLQPKVSLRTRKVAGAEALVRWYDPELGFVEPDVFIPVLERNGFITQLDRYMFERCCALLRQWLDQGLDCVPISVNFSRANLRRDAFSQFQQLQQRWKVPPELLEFEFTETLVGKNPTYFADLAARMHRAGFRCSMDDFGSSYSSLYMLQQVPVDTLKLDKSLFDGLLDEQTRPRARIMVQSVLEMARRLGMETVAEGIDSPVQLSILEELCCDLVQGYYFSRPLPAEEFQAAFLHPVEEEQ